MHTHVPTHAASSRLDPEKPGAQRLAGTRKDRNLDEAGADCTGERGWRTAPRAAPQWVLLSLPHTRAWEPHSHGPTTLAKTLHSSGRLHGRGPPAPPASHDLVHLCELTPSSSCSHQRLRCMAEARASRSRWGEALHLLLSPPKSPPNAGSLPCAAPPLRRDTCTWAGGG